jgi:hypothetical protein
MFQHEAFHESQPLSQVSASSDRFPIDNLTRSIIAMSFQLHRFRRGIHHGNLILRFQNTSSAGFFILDDQFPKFSCYSLSLLGEG